MRNDCDMGASNAVDLERKVWGLSLIAAPALFAVSTFFWIHVDGGQSTAPSAARSSRWPPSSGFPRLWGCST
jgi:hypothetical protein